MTVLDTHAWIWWISAPENLSDTQQEAIEASRAGLIVSAISTWEVAKLVELVASNLIDRYRSGSSPL